MVASAEDVRHFSGKHVVLRSFECEVHGMHRRTPFEERGDDTSRIEPATQERDGTAITTQTTSDSSVERGVCIFRNFGQILMNRR